MDHFDEMRLSRGTPSLAGWICESKMDSATYGRKPSSADKLPLDVTKKRPQRDLLALSLGLVVV